MVSAIDFLYNMFGFLSVMGFFFLPAAVFFACIFILYKLIKTRMILARDHVLFRVCLFVQMLITFSFTDSIFVEALPGLFKQVFPIAMVLAFIVSVIKFRVAARHRQAFIEANILTATRYIFYLWVGWACCSGIMIFLRVSA